MNLRILTVGAVNLGASTLRDIRIFANDRGREAAHVGFANQLAAESGAPEWIEIPFGNFDHSNGMQVFDRASADQVVANFQSDLLGRLKGGVPIYVGHPDVPAFANQYKDKSARGWAKEMQAADSGLRIRVKWNPAGEALIANEEYKFFSPVWAATPVPGKSRNYRPVRIRSIGLTNEPNLPVEPLTNANEATPENTMPQWLLTMLGLPAEATEDEVKAALQALLDKCNAMQEPPPELENERRLRIEAEGLLANERTVRGSTEQRVSVLETSFANERRARVDLLLANAIREGRITEAHRPQWASELAANFDAKSVELANAKPVLSTSATTKNLGQRKETAPAANKAIELANERMTRTGESWAVCWAAVKRDNPALFEQMQTAKA